MLKKTEKKPMFELNKKSGNVNGTPHIIDKIMDRYNILISRYIRVSY